MVAGTAAGRRALRPAGLLVGLVGAVAVRLGIAGPDGVRSPAAGAAFAVLLAALALAPRAGRPPHPGRRWLPWGAVGAALLCAVPLVVHLRTPGPALATSQLPVWAAVVTAVAVAEELLLRGALWDALDTWPHRPWVRRWGRPWVRPWVTVAVTSVVFALIHWPFYGASALPLDLAVGLLLGALRQLTDGWAAPAFAHATADLAGWWLR